MSEEAGRYILVDSATGQQIERSDITCARLEDQIKGLQRDVRGWAARYAELERDKNQAAKHHPRYGDGELAFRHWKSACSHKRSPFTADRFWLVLPFLENKKYGLKAVLKAIEGAAYDAFETKRRNGTVKRHDGWELIFKDAGKFEEFCNKAPIKRDGDLSAQHQ